MVHLSAFNTPQFDWGRNRMEKYAQPLGKELSARDRRRGDFRGRAAAKARSMGRIACGPSHTGHPARAGEAVQRALRPAIGRLQRNQSVGERRANLDRRGSVLSCALAPHKCPIRRRDGSRGGKGFRYIRCAAASGLRSTSRGSHSPWRLGSRHTGRNEIPCILSMASLGAWRCSSGPHGAIHAERLLYCHPSIGRLADCV